jgi:hypothetical protein
VTARFRFTETPRQIPRGQLRHARVFALIQMLLDRYTRLGYRIFLQGDADGNDQDIFRQIISKGAVSKERTLLFKHDFETSVLSRCSSLP